MLRGLTRLGLTLVVLALIGLGLYDYVAHVDDNHCSMTYMRAPPNLIPVALAPSVADAFPHYRLMLYCEGHDCAELEALRFRAPNQIPVLFVPGNADSHMQVRSLASVALDKARKAKYAASRLKFHYFTIGFNEELSAMYGPLLSKQTRFVRHCVAHIVQLFGQVQPAAKRPGSVLIVGNSMGGIVARGIFLEDDDNNNAQGEDGVPPAPDVRHLVHTIITQATPHMRPVLSIDSHMADYYARVNRLWTNSSDGSLKNVVLASLYGGYRDILVRAGLANINGWRTQSTAAIISSYTVSMPQVWRSIDHRCMSWCRELMMTVNRALFDMIDSQTGQLAIDRARRESTLRFHLQRDVKQRNSELSSPSSSSPPTDHSNSIRVRAPSTTTVQHIVQRSLMNLEHNSFRDTNALYVFDLHALLAETDSDTDKNVDSLFVYTNVNAPESFLLCATFDRADQHDHYECSRPVDLMARYGRSIPPYLEGAQKEVGLKTLHVHDLRALATAANGTSSPACRFLVFHAPVWKRTPTRPHQLIVKFDWYAKRARERHVRALPVELQLEPLEQRKQPSVVFRRFYLNSLTNVLQAYRLQVVSPQQQQQPQQQPPTCDDYLRKHTTAKSSFALSDASLMIQFAEPVRSESVTDVVADADAAVDEPTTTAAPDHIYHSQAVQGKSIELTLRLSANLPPSVRAAAVYIDLIQFDVRHLVTQSTPAVARDIEQSAAFFADCAHTTRRLVVSVDHAAIVGQFVRFYAMHAVAFLVCLLQFYDFVTLRRGASGDDGDDRKFRSYLILSRVQTRLGALFKFCAVLSSLVGAHHLVAERLPLTLLPTHDWAQMELERIGAGHGVWLLPLPLLLLFWSAYAILSTATLFLSLVLAASSFALHRVLFRVVPLLRRAAVSHLLFAAHLALTCVACYFASAIAHCLLFYGAIVRLAASNPLFSSGDNSDSNRFVHFSLRQSRTLFVYLMLVLRLPALLVWTKSLATSMATATTTTTTTTTALLRPLFQHSADNGFAVAVFSIALWVVWYFTDDNAASTTNTAANRRHRRNFPATVVSWIVLLNACLTVLYATVQIYRLPFFIVAHLCLMCVQQQLQWFSSSAELSPKLKQN